MNLRSSCLLLIAAVLAGCVSPLERSTGTVPLEPTAPTQAVEGERYTIDTATSWLHILVYKTGPLARFGHNHVMSTTAIGGSVVIADEFAASAFSIRVPLEQLIVDDASARSAEGPEFPREIPANDRTGTRANMLGSKLLNAAVFPTLELHSTRVTGVPSQITATAAVHLAGNVNEVAFDIDLNLMKDKLIAKGQTSVTHQQLGLEPFSALGGALRVRDDIALKYYIVAHADKVSL